MNIGIIDVDGHNFPNLALMKISAYHKGLGDTVGWYDVFSKYDIVYKGKVFTFTEDYSFHIINSDMIISGGTGYGIDSSVPDEFIYPDYDLYDGVSWYDKDIAYGFLTRGCIRNCSWCIVPRKEGFLKEYMEIGEIVRDKKKVILMDNNVLASDFGLNQIEKIGDLGIKVDFNQGLDARIISKDIDIAKLLGRIKWLKPLRLACDSDGMIDYVKGAVDMLRDNGCKPTQYFVYVLLTDLESSYRRISFCKKMGLDAFAQPFRDFSKGQIIPQWQLDMARYVNHKAIYRSIDFKDYMPRKGFKCSGYF